MAVRLLDQNDVIDLRKLRALLTELEELPSIVERLNAELGELLDRVYSEFVKPLCSKLVTLGDIEVERFVVVDIDERLRVVKIAVAPATVQFFSVPPTIKVYSDKPLRLGVKLRSWNVYSDDRAELIADVGREWIDRDLRLTLTTARILSFVATMVENSDAVIKAIRERVSEATELAKRVRDMVTQVKAMSRIDALAAF